MNTRLNNLAKTIGLLSIAYANLELGRLILQYITLVYKVPLLPEFFINRGANPTALVEQPLMPFIAEFLFVLLGLLYVFYAVVHHDR